MTKTLILTALMTLLSVSGCAVEPPSGIEREGYCVETACEVLEDECEQAAWEEAYYDCLDGHGNWRYCGDHADWTTGCDLDCADDSPCVEKGYRFHLPESDPNILRACELYWAKQALCDEVVTDLCGTWARIERPETAEVYDCASVGECGEEPESCFADLEPAGLPDFCTALETQCESSCTPEQLAYLEGEDRFIRADVAEALADCLNEPTCDEASSCASAWFDATMSR